MATANFDHFLSSLTLSELMFHRKAVHDSFVRGVKSVERYERYHERLLRKLDMNRTILNTYLEYGVVNAKICRLEEKIRRLEELTGCYQDYWLHEVRDRDRAKAELDMIDDAIMRCKTTDSVEAEPLTLSVRLLSGDVLSIQVDRSLRISAFADYFCKTHGYAPCATKRMTFMKKQEEAKSSDELEDEIFWSDEIRREGEVMDDHVEDGDMLYLIIQPLEDPEWLEKFSLFRRILEKEGRIARKDYEEIFSIYSTWLLTWIPPANTNRYIRLKAFVDENEDIFPIVEKK